tara:strand:- start:130 stop:630 length:501 start_codon:yes stop_codon:yes gene_type:complete
LIKKIQVIKINMSVHLDTRKIIKDWTDYNEHMNMAYYVLIFDEAWETMLNKFNMGGANAKVNKRSTMVVETRTTYNNEVKENEEVDVFCTFFDHDKKRLHLKCEMYEKKTKKLAATMENLSLYIDLEKRKVTEFEEDKLEIMDKFIEENKTKFNSDNLVLSDKLKK